MDHTPSGRERGQVFLYMAVALLNCITAEEMKMKETAQFVHSIQEFPSKHAKLSIDEYMRRTQTFVTLYLRTAQNLIESGAVSLTYHGSDIIASFQQVVKMLKVVSSSAEMCATNGMDEAMVLTLSEILIGCRYTMLFIFLDNNFRQKLTREKVGFYLQQCMASLDYALDIIISGNSSLERPKALTLNTSEIDLSFLQLNLRSRT